MGNLRYSKARSDCNKHIINREHYTRKKGKIKQKKQFNSKEDAICWIEKYKMIGYNAYMCSQCNKWHIGRK